MLNLGRSKVVFKPPIGHDAMKINGLIGVCLRVDHTKTLEVASKKGKRDVAAVQGLKNDIVDPYLLQSIIQIRGVFGSSRHVGEENVHLVAPSLIVLARADAELLELVERSAVDVQDSRILGNALKERGTIGELEVVKQRIQGCEAIDHPVEVQCATTCGVDGLAGRPEGLLALGEVDLRCILVAESFAPSYAVVIVELPVAREHVWRVQRGMEVS